ncbi:DUF389 domain-containing protein [Monashia sp. NPDC004114]
MVTALRIRILPEHQRRSREELSDELELGSGDATAKRSAFWTMLTLSAVIASAGVLGDSTATVIGAMIIAPLSTPIMGIALATVKRQRNGSVGYVCFGVLLVIGIGAAFSLALPSTYALLDNSQISSRVSPNLVDLVAALATGLAGAVALARRDVGAVLPGVAIAISLVPPLSVVGVCLGQGSFTLAAGAFLLFVSNLVSLVLAGMFVFAVLGYSSPETQGASGSSRGTYAAIGGLLVVVVVFLGANTITTYLTTRWENQVMSTASEWVETVPGATVDSVTLHGSTFTIHITSPTALPSTSELLADLDGKVPNGFQVAVADARGQTIDVGTVGP